MEQAPVFCTTYAPDDEGKFWRYPTNKVIGTFADPDGVSKAIRALKDAGHDEESIEVLCGQEGEKRLDVTGERHGFWGALLRSFQALSAEHLYLDYYQTELNQGHYLVQVAVKGRPEKLATARLLHDAGGKRVTHYGTWFIEQIANQPEHDQTSGYGISRTVDVPFDEAVRRVTETLKEEGFGVLTEIDLKEKFKEKLDKDFGQYKILGACNPAFAYDALGLDMELGLLLPCNVVVYESGAGTTVAAIDPVRMMSVAEKTELNEIAKEVEIRLRRAIDAV